MLTTTNYYNSPIIYNGRNSHTNAEKASVGASSMQILMKFLCNYVERPFIDLFNDITNVNITQSLHITFAQPFKPSKSLSDVERGKEKSEMCQTY